MEDEDHKTSVQKISDLLADSKRSAAYLIVVAGKETAGRMFRLERGEMIIGRSAEADIHLDDDGVSRKHAKVVTRPDGSVEVVDLGSTNGTFHNGNRVDIQALKDGDKIQIGSSMILKLSYQDHLDEALQRNLYDSATRDGLTRLYNKKFFLDAIEKEVSHSLRHRVPLSVVMIDLDHFKQVNDTFGHQAGDYVLQRTAQLMTATKRAEDVLARYGGEEFVAILRECEEDQAFLFSERVRRIIEGAEFTFNAQRITVTVSIGIATAKDAEYAGANELVAAADKYLYRAKQGGRNKVEGKMLSG